MKYLYTLTATFVFFALSVSSFPVRERQLFNLQELSLLSTALSSSRPSLSLFSEPDSVLDIPPM